MKKIAFLPLFVGVLLQAQSINIGNFYYRDYLDFGQNKGSFSSGNPTLTGKDGSTLTIPHIPDFQASSNYGSLTSVGRGFVATAAHVQSPESAGGLLDWGLTKYKIATQPVQSGDSEVGGTSKSYGYDTKFWRLNKYVVEGQAEMLDTQNTITQSEAQSEKEKNIKAFKEQVDKFKDSDGNIYLYQAGSGIVTLQGTINTQTFYTDETGERRGGGFGTFGSVDYYNAGIAFYYQPMTGFYNKITSGDSGSGIYAYDSKNNKWVLLGVVSRDNGATSLASNIDFRDYQKNFEKSVDLNGGSWTIDGTNLNSSNNSSWQSLDNNKDIIFSSGGTIEVKNNIDRMQSGYVGGFVFTATNSATAQNPTKYTFTNKGDYFFTGSGLDIGENVVVEWALRNKSGESLHKIGKGELIVKTAYTGSENLGYLKLGEGKVTLDTTNKAFEGVYITSGRGEVALKQAEAIGAIKENANALNSNNYTLAQEDNKNMGFYFGTGGGRFDLAGNSLHLNTIAANDSKAIILNSNSNVATSVEIQGFGYEGGKKTDKKADTIIHASFGELSANALNSSTATNLNLIYKDSKTHNVSLVFDGHINIKGALSAENSNIVLQGHPTAHATISDETIRKQVINSENGTSKPMSECMDLSKVSQLCQSDWDSRNFIIEKGIELKNATLTIGKAAKVTADINADSTSAINFGGTHFIDERDTKNVGGSGFDYYQVVTSGELKNESYKDSAYSGTIKAEGTTITSSFFDFSPNLDLSNGAKLNAKSLTLGANTLNFKGNSTANIENLTFQGIKESDKESILNKISLDDNSKFEVTKSFTFDNSTFDLKNLTSKANLTLPTEYNLYALNGSNISAGEFKNSKADAEFEVRNSTFSAESMSFDKSVTMLLDKGTLKLTKTFTSTDLTLNLSNEGKFEASGATLTLTNFTLNLQNQSSFNADKITTSGNLNITGDENSTLFLKTLELNSGTATLKAKANITNLNLKNVSSANINQNISITNLDLTKSSANILNSSISVLNLNESTATLDKLGQIQSVTLKTNSHLYFDELNLNTHTATLTSDETSQTHIKRLSFDTSNNANGTKTAPQSNLAVSELLKFDKVGANLGKSQSKTNSDEALKKDLLALEFGKKLTLENGAGIEVNFAELVKKDNDKLQFDKDYMVFSAKDLSFDEGFSNIVLNLAGSGADFFAKGDLDKDKNAFFVRFMKNNPRDFDELNQHIDNPAYSPLLEVLLEHDKNDESINKAINTSDYNALNARLAQLDKSFENLANADNGVLKTLPLLQKQEINARIQHNRFSNAKFALARMKNPTQQSDIVPKLLYLENEERKNRAWSNASASFFVNNGDKFNLQSISIGYDRKLFADEFLLGIMASATNAQLSSNEMKNKPKIYALALYSDTLFARSELQNELSFSLLNGDRDFEGDNGSYKSFHSFFESIYKVEFTFLPQNIKPLVLTRVNLSHFDEFSTAIYKQKADNDISVDLGLGFEWLWQKENGFYSATFIAERDIFHSQKENFISLKNAQKFIAYKTNEPSFSYQLYFSGLENFKNGFYLRYGLSAFIDSKAYKGIKGDVQVGYKF